MAVGLTNLICSLYDAVVIDEIYANVHLSVAYIMTYFVLLSLITVLECYSRP